MRFPNQLVRIRAQLEEYVLRCTRAAGEDDAYSMLFNFYQRKANTIITVAMEWINLLLQLSSPTWMQRVSEY